MARVTLTPGAVQGLDSLISAYSLPDDTDQRVSQALRVLTQFPMFGRALHGRGDGTRCISGPWPWMLLIYVWIEAEDLVAVVAVKDARSAQSPD